MKKKRLIKKKKKEDDKRERKNMPHKSNIRVCTKPDNRCYLQKKRSKEETEGHYYRTKRLYLIDSKKRRAIINSFSRGVAQTVFAHIDLWEKIQGRKQSFTRLLPPCPLRAHMRKREGWRSEMEVRDRCSSIFLYPNTGIIFADYLDFKFLSFSCAYAYMMRRFRRKRVFFGRNSPRCWKERKGTARQKSNGKNKEK